MNFLPISKNELKERNIAELDFVLISGDAYVDHPSFGTAIISRYLEAFGFTVGIIPQPDWTDIENFKILGKPRLAFLVTSGNIDSMVNHYTVAKKPRQKDAYSPGGKIGLRPDRADIVYTNKIREAYGKVPVILGGIEASLRRFSHYDYWDNKIRRSILLDSSADILVYGMGENQIIEIAEALESGIPISEITFIKGTSYVAKNLDNVYDFKMLPTYTEVLQDKYKYSDSFLIQYYNTDPYTSKTLVENYREGFVVQNTPAIPLKTNEFDRVYSLNYARNYHPIYEKDGGIPAIEEVKFSLISNRGCFGECNFCALTFHQGRIVTSRSHESIISEAQKITWDKDFKGYIHDVGGPTANFRFPACEKQMGKGSCNYKKCLYPTTCKNLNVTHENYLNLLRKLREIPKVKKVFIRSGIRFDYLMADPNNQEFMNELCEHHISGQLKVAPEHVSPKVLKQMGKPPIEIFENFKKKYYTTNTKLDKKQYLVPYFISSHPGSDIHAAIELSEYLRDTKFSPEQVQDFYPTPGTLSTCVYYTEFDPVTKEKVYVEKSPHGKAIQRALMQYKLPQNYKLVLEGLKLAKRDDLIGFDEKALIRPGAVNRHYKKKKEIKEAIQRKKETNNKSNQKKTRRKPIRNIHKPKNK